MAFDFSSFTPDKSTPIPMHYQIRKFIQDNIENGKLAADECLPPELELASTFNVSRSTVRQAINDLVVKEVLYRRRGKGTFVKQEKTVSTFFQKLNSFNEEMMLKGKMPSTKQISLEVIEPIPSVNAALGIDKNEPLIYLERLRFVDNQPNVYMESYLPYSIFQGMEFEDMNDRSMYSVMNEKFGVSVDRVLRHIEVANATKKIAQMLSVKNGAAIFLVSFTGYAFDGSVPVEYSVSRYRGDVNRFVVELSK